LREKEEKILFSFIGSPDSPGQEVTFNHIPASFWKETSMKLSP
jgi:hypothetical protein